MLIKNLPYYAGLNCSNHSISILIFGIGIAAIAGGECMAYDAINDVILMMYVIIVGNLAHSSPLLIFHLQNLPEVDVAGVLWMGWAGPRLVATWLPFNQRSLVNSDLSAFWHQCIASTLGWSILSM